MEKIQLGDICEIINGFAFESSNYVSSGIRIIRISNVQKGYIEDNNPAFYPSDSNGLDKYLLEEGDLLVSLTGNVGRVAVLEKRFLPAALNQRVACLRPKTDKLLKGYLFHILNNNNFERQCIQASNGVAQKNLSTEWLKSYKIDLCDLETQERMERTLNIIRDIIAHRKSELSKLDTLVKSRFIEMFGDPVTNPYGYPIYSLSDISSSRLGKMLDRKKQTGENSHPYLANYNVQWFRFELGNLNKMDFDEADRQEFELKKGDLLVCEGGEVGRCAIWNNEMEGCYFQKALHRVRCNPEYIIPEYLGYTFFWHSQYNGFSDAISGVSTIAHLPGDRLKKLQIIVPPLDLQHRFAEFIHLADKSKSVLQKLLEKQELLRAALMQEYFG